MQGACFLPEIAWKQTSPSRVLWIKALYLFNRKRHTLLSYEDLFLQIHTCNRFLPYSPFTQASLSCTACQISPLQLIGYPRYRDIGYRLLVTCHPISDDIFPDGNHHGSNPDEGWMAQSIPTIMHTVLPSYGVQLWSFAPMSFRKYWFIARTNVACDNPPVYVWFIYLSTQS